MRKLTTNLAKSNASLVSDQTMNNII